MEGVGVSIDTSHPRVLQAILDFYNSTLSIRAIGLGESTLHLYLTGENYIFDIIKVHVTSVIEPMSPVFVHLGGTIQFKSGQEHAGIEKAVWSSEDSSIIE